MTTQLRIYTINRGQMDAFVPIWRAGVVPLRRKLGFRVESAWIIRETNQFLWLVSYDGPQTWEEMERKLVDPDPASFIARMELHFVDPAGGGG